MSKRAKAMIAATLAVTLFVVGLAWADCHHVVHCEVTPSGSSCENVGWSCI